MKGCPVKIEQSGLSVEYDDSEQADRQVTISHSLTTATLSMSFSDAIRLKQMLGFVTDE